MAAAAAEGSTADKTVSTKPDDNNTQSTSGIEDLFKDSPSLAPSTVSEKPIKDVKNDIMSLFDKSNVVSPFSVHQQQLAMLAQQQSLLMAAAAKSAGVVPQFAGNAQPLGPNGTNLPTQNWPNVGYQFPGVMMTAAGNIELQKYMQRMVNMGQSPVGCSVPFPTSSLIPVGTTTLSQWKSSSKFDPCSQGGIKILEWKHHLVTHGIPLTPLEPFDYSVSMVNEVISGTDDDPEDPTTSAVFS